jgi:transposase InsO family protein
LTEPALRQDPHQRGTPRKNEHRLHEPVGYRVVTSSVLQRPLEPEQYTALRFGETLLLEGLIPSVGSVGDALDNALAETTIGLYKTECIRDGSPFRTGPIATLADLEQITSAWVHWYNTARLMHRLGRRPPAEVEAEYWANRARVVEASTP